MLRSYLLLYFSLLTVIELLDPRLAGSLLHLPLQCRVIVVLNMIVGSTFQVFSNLGPAVPVDFVIFEDLVILLDGPFHLLDVWVEMIVPPEQEKHRN